VSTASEAVRLAVLADSRIGQHQLGDERTRDILLEGILAASVAQTHATLVLAEHQHIANLIAWVGDGEPTDDVLKFIQKGLLP